jgi:predicted small secreted protein
MKTTQKRIVMILIGSAMLALFGASCSTVRGFGRDVGTAGEHIEDASR